MKNKSKIVSLRKKQERLEFWKKYGGWILCVNALISISLIPVCVMAPIGLTISLLESFYCGSSLFAMGYHEIFGDKKVKTKMNKIDEQISKLVREDKEELNINSQYNKLTEIKAEIKESKKEERKQKKLIKEMVDRKNLGARNQRRLIRELTRTKKAQAKIEAEKEILNQTQENQENIINV